MYWHIRKTWALNAHLMAQIVGKGGGVALIRLWLIICIIMSLS